MAALVYLHLHLSSAAATMKSTDAAAHIVFDLPVPSCL
jgi:hypothetical protein